MVTSIGFLRRIINIIIIPVFCLRKNKLHNTTTIDTGTFLRDCVIGKYCYIGKYCVLNSVDVGNYTCIASGVQIGGMEHSINDLSISPTLTGDNNILGVRTTIGHDVWIAANCIIKQGITIGDGAVIGANSFVNRDVEPYSIVFGSPAKFHRYRKCKAIERVLNDSKYWESNPVEAKKILDDIASLKSD